MHNQFKVISISYKNTPVEVREMMAFDETLSKRLYRMISDYSDISEAFILSTCNRTELYYASPENHDSTLLKLITLAKGLENLDLIKKYFVYCHDHSEVISHLFYVALGLEAQVVGDLQIINQVKSAYQWAADADMAGPFLHRLMHSIFFTNKRVVQETTFRDGSASVSYATVECIEVLVSGLEKPRILIIGLGEIGRDVAKNLENLPQKEVLICNRNIQEAYDLAKQMGYTVVPFEHFQKEIHTADVIVSSVRKDEPLITKEMFAQESIMSHKYLFDLSVPRSVDRNIEEVNGLLLYNIDHIQNKTSEALKRRLKAIPQVQAIIKETLSEFQAWSKEMEVSPVIHRLKQALEDIRKEEIAKYLKKINDKESQLLDQATKSMMQKIIKLPVLQLKAACKRGEADTLVEALSDVFNLEAQTKSEG